MISRNHVVHLYVVILCSLLKNIHGQIASPCPGIFEYSSNLQDGFGIIKVPATYLKGEVTIAVTILGEFIEGHGEGLELLKNTSAAFEDAKNGLEVEIKVKFPFARGYPVVQTITIGNQSICNSLVDSTTSSMTLELTTQFSPSTWISEYRFNNVCGIPNDPKPTILTIHPDKHPWLAAIYRVSRHNSRIREFVCAGTLVSDRHVITAAHCVTREKKVYLELGVFDRLKTDDDEYILRDSRSIIIHPDYHKRRLYADIAIVSFENVKDFTERIAPICLWSFGPKQDSYKGSVIGWGWDERDEPIRIPYQIQNTMISQATCIAKDSLLEQFSTNTSFCAGGDGGATCRQDSGGGFVIRKNNRWYLRGVLIAALGCNVNNYEIYTDIAAPNILDWLKQYLTQV